MNERMKPSMSTVELQKIRKVTFRDFIAKLMPSCHRILGRPADTLVSVPWVACMDLCLSSHCSSWKWPSMTDQLNPLWPLRRCSSQSQARQNQCTDQRPCKRHFVAAMRFRYGQYSAGDCPGLRGPSSPQQSCGSPPVSTTNGWLGYPLWFFEFVLRGHGHHYQKNLEIP